MSANPLTLPVSLPAPGTTVRLLAMLVRLAPTRWKFYDRSILLRKRLVPADPVSTPPGHRWVWAAEPEIAAIDRNPEATSPTAYPRRFKRGDACLCLMAGDEIVGYRWIARHRSCLYCGFGPRYELRFLPLKPDQAFVYDLYVYERYRRHGYAALICNYMFEALRQQGVEEAFSLIDPDNHPVIGLNLRLGAEPVCMAYGFRIRQWSTMLLGPASDGPLLKAWFQQWHGGSSPATARVASVQ
jgi:GNAT superfamily N-acetyltransferase